MRPALALIALALLAGCHRPRADQPSPGADSDAQAATANKTIADIQAADEASRGPAPEIAPVAHREKAEDEVAAKVEAAPADEATTVTSGDGNQTNSQ